MNRYDMTLDGTENNLVQGLTVENPTGLKATLLSQTGKMQNLFLPYPAKGTLSFPNGRLEDVPIHFEAENGKWFSVRENTARYAAVENPFEKRLPLHSQELILIRNGNAMFMLYTEEVR